MKIGFIGLGNMGAPMASHISQRYPTLVYNRSSEKAEHWLSQNPTQTIASSPAEMAQHADIIVLCIGNDEDVRQTITGKNGILTSAKSGLLIIDHTTTSADLAREMNSTCRQQGIHYLDAPVSGGQQGAINGKLTVMVGGEKLAFEQAKTVLNCYSANISLMGPSGAGQLTKMVNQICVAGLIEALAEGMHFGLTAGLDMEKVMSLLSSGAASSWQMVNRHKTMIQGEYNHGFAVNHMRKDLDICLAQAQNLELQLPVTSQVNQYYDELQTLGEGNSDTSSLLKRLQVLANKKASEGV